MTDWHWSEWITPTLVFAKANGATANAGASVTINASSDPNAAVDAVRTGGATGGSSLSPGGTAPYTYQSTNELDLDPSSSGYIATGYDRSGVDEGTVPASFAALNVGYAYSFWRERPDLRQVPPEFYNLRRGEDWVPIDPDDPTWAGAVEFEPGVDTVGVRWSDVWLDVGVDSASTVAGNIGYSTGILLPSTGGAWSGSFGAWPPPLGGNIAHIEHGSIPSAESLAIEPPAGSDFTIVCYTDMAVSGYATDNAWQYWTVRPTGGFWGQIPGILHQMPRYRYRIPNTAVAPRFFVKHQDDSMRPVGFGKPASELTVFRVPGGGRWRDLTTDEYATYGPTVRPPGGVALKVKRLDASGSPWWDHVAWMVPDV